MDEESEIRDEEEFENPTSSIKLPRFKEWSIEDIYDPDEMIVDHETLESHNLSAMAARKALFKLNEEINRVERKEALAKLKMDREFKRHFVQSTQKTATEKKIRAELASEKWENKYLYYRQYREELQRHANTVREELRALQSEANNLRQQLRL